MMLVPPLLGYAETHYKMGFVPSLLKKNEPEIIFDAPHRLSPGSDLPVLLLIKDAHRYPVQVLDAAVELTVPGRPVVRRSFDLGGETVEAPWWWRVLQVPRPDDLTGDATVRVQGRFRQGEREFTVVADNHAKTSHEPFAIHLAEEPLPYPEGWHAGDMHTHSHLTADQVEFGVPWDAALPLVRALGLSWFAVADHSYDLDDHHHSFLERDPDLKKWHQLWQAADELEARGGDVVLLPGEELSVGNSHRRNVHMLILGNREFFDGWGDSAERWLRNKPQWLIPAVLERLDATALVAAAHPGAPVPALEWLLLRRGRWTSRDLQHPRLDGMQVLNGAFDDSFDRGLSLWIRMLLSGARLLLYGGNDAHGNFARFRQIGFPFFTMREGPDQRFGVAKTVVYLGGPPDRQSLLRALKQGQVVVTDGPFLEIHLRGQNGAESRMGQVFRGAPQSLHLRARSSPEYGYVREISVWLGAIGGREVRVQRIRRTKLAYTYETEVRLPSLPRSGYIRAVLFTRRNGDHYAFTNPVWFDQTG